MLQWLHSHATNAVVHKALPQDRDGGSVKSLPRASPPIKLLLLRL
jgi:hypothetical protein